MTAAASRSTDVISLTELLRTEYAPRRLNLSRGSADQIGYSIRALERFAGHELAVHELTETLLLSWLRSSMDGSVSRSTLKRWRGDLLTLWRFAHKRGLHPHPAADIDPILVPKKIPRAFSVLDLECVLTVTRRLRGQMRNIEISRASWYTSLILFLYDSGARISAALEVETQHLNMEGRYVLLEAENSKTGIEQALNLSDQTVAAIAGHFDPSRELLFPYPWNRRRLWLDLQEICDAAGVVLKKGEGFHILRRTHATQAVRVMGWARAQANLGHTQEQMTRRYVDPRQLDRGSIDLPRPNVG